MENCIVRYAVTARVVVPAHGEATATLRPKLVEFWPEAIHAAEEERLAAFPWFGRAAAWWRKVSGAPQPALQCCIKSVVWGDRRCPNSSVKLGETIDVTLMNTADAHVGVVVACTGPGRTEDDEKAG